MHQEKTLIVTVVHYKRTKDQDEFVGYTVSTLHVPIDKSINCSFSMSNSHVNL